TGRAALKVQPCSVMPTGSVYEMMMRPDHGTRHTPRAVRTEGARRLISAARAETDCCIVLQSTSSAYKIPSWTPAKAWTIHVLPAFIAFSRESGVISSGRGDQDRLCVSAG